MGREGYHHPCPTRAMSMPGSPSSATRAAAGVTHGKKTVHRPWQAAAASSHRIAVGYACIYV